MSRIKVTINKKGYIPGLGQGPIRRPVSINEELYAQLVALGYPVSVINPPAKLIVKQDTPIEQPITESKESIPVDNVDFVVEGENEPTAEEVQQDLVIENNEEEVIDDSEEVLEILENDPNLSAEGFYTEGFLTSKNLCKKILSNREVQYDSNASFTLLKQLVLQSNPEIVE